MSSLKILLVVIFMLVAIMIITAAVQLIAPYVAVLVVLGSALWFLTREETPKE